MAASNLDFSIGADTSKARVDLKLLQQELKNVNKEIDNAIKAGDIAQANQLSVAYGNIEKQSVALKNSLRAQRTETDHANNSLKELIHSGRGLGRVVGEFSNLSRGTESLTGILGGLVGGFTGGLFGVAVARGFDALVASMDEVAERLTKIRDLSRETGAKPLVVQGMQELAKESGESAETANKFMSGLSSTLTKVATQTRDVQTGLKAGATAATDLNRNFATFGDKVVQVNRGGVGVTRDFSDALAILQVNEERLIKLPLEQQMKIVSEAFLRTEQNAKRLGITEVQLNAIAKDIFTVPLESADALAKAYVNRGAKVAELAKAERGATKENIQSVDEVAAAQEKLSQQTQNFTSGLATYWRALRLESLKSSVELIKNFPQTVKEVQKVSADQIQSDFADLPNFFEGLTTTIAGFFKDVKYVDPNASDQIQTEFAGLPTFFQGLTTNLSKIWSGFWKTFGIASAQAADQGIAHLKQLQTAANQARSSLTITPGQEGQPGLPYVGRGPGTGDTGGYGPPSGGIGYGPQGSAFMESAGDPGSRLQSINPGLSNYQAPPPKVVYPVAESASRGWTAAIKTAAESSADAAAASQSAAEASAKAVNAVVNPPFKAYAAGGMIRGPGSGTSDSILARLSDGEYVMRAAAVNRWGPRFMDAINGFSAGGLARPIPRFAGGGMVTATTSDGVTVNLNFPGGSFALRADNDIVAGLTREARRAGMMGGGRRAGLLE